MMYTIPNVVEDQFAARQINDNYNQDTLTKFRGTLSRVRRRAMLSKDPKQIASYLQLANMLGVDPGFSVVGRASDRKARAENKYNQDTLAAQFFQPPMQWLNQQPVTQVF